MTTSVKSAQISVGTRVHCILYGGRNGSVVDVEGQSSAETVKSLLGGLCMTGGNATYDVIWDDGSENRMIPECIIRGVQWRIAEGNPSSRAISPAKSFHYHCQRCSDSTIERLLSALEDYGVRSPKANDHLAILPSNLISARYEP